MNTFAKIFGPQIFGSSLSEDPAVRHTFMDLLALADPEGVVDMTHEAIARVTNVPADDVRRCIAALEQPDHRSRSPERDGRRIVRLDEHRDWGWAIVNWTKYRESARREDLRLSTAERVARHRARKKGPPAPPKEQEEVQKEKENNGCNGDVTVCNATTVTSVTEKAALSPSNLQDVLSEASMHGILASDAEAFFHHFEASGWVDKNGNVIMNWRAKLRSWATRSRSNQAEHQHHADGCHPTVTRPAFPSELRAQLADLNREIDAIRGPRAADGSHVRTLTPEQQQTLKTKVARRKAVKQQLENQYDRP